MKQTELMGISGSAESPAKNSRKKRAFGFASTVAGLLSLAAVVGVMFFAGPVVDTRLDKSDLAYGLMIKARQNGGNPDLNYKAVDRYFSNGTAHATVKPLSMTIVAVD